MSQAVLIKQILMREIKQRVVIIKQEGSFGIRIKK